jgi:hypothetical protein
MKISELLATHQEVAQQALTESVRHKQPLLDNPFRMLSEAWFAYFQQAKLLDDTHRLTLSESDQELLKTDIGEFGEHDGVQVPLDVILQTPDHVQEAEYQGKEVELNKPKRGGSKKFYVYVRNPKTGNVKKISFGDTSGLTVKLRDPKRRAAFAARHRCEQANDKMTARYWACRLPRYRKSLGLSGGGQWW